MNTFAIHKPQQRYSICVCCKLGCVIVRVCIKWMHGLCMCRAFGDTFCANVFQVCIMKMFNILWMFMAFANTPPPSALLSFIDHDEGNLIRKCCCVQCLNLQKKTKRSIITIKVKINYNNLWEVWHKNKICNTIGVYYIQMKWKWINQIIY